MKKITEGLFRIADEINEKMVHSSFWPTKTVKLETAVKDNLPPSHKMSIYNLGGIKQEMATFKISGKDEISLVKDSKNTGDESTTGDGYRIFHNKDHEGVIISRKDAVKFLQDVIKGEGLKSLKDLKEKEHLLLK